MRACLFAGTIMTVLTPQDVLSAARQPVPKIADMRFMKILEVR